ncbi:unnamed protein product [Vitrella brassicaformis CCMP3155]|uniref:RRM domain-containing protein n=1 Tax=Vitrella brassicaformis (strain CCMP3155) TaxID=1169540 RepID=A0A0G4H7W4_VITBC|nr:unnamed protein product [Vitrella brassicaformis CCMP3155]|mmetsp:Transcript_47979/g.120068  ORF Transcript_47979/g.120068 Transcript_47979/m.120068 type:complete len:788 (-) Transcript_47979:107-2470(-)|eukprot:CEM39966.1 unnamed protein product [Vitrella brassicaformis CCMP3155]
MAATGSKIRVGNIHPLTPKEKLIQEFQQYGHVLEVDVGDDCAYVTFERSASARAACADAHTIMGRRLSLQYVAEPLIGACKVFVGGVPNVSEEIFTQYFSKFGKIRHSTVYFHPVTGRPRGFGFVEYETEDGALECLKHYRSHSLMGKWVEVKRAVLADSDQPHPCPANPKKHLNFSRRGPNRYSNTNNIHNDHYTHHQQHQPYRTMQPFNKRGYHGGSGGGGGGAGHGSGGVGAGGGGAGGFMGRGNAWNQEERNTHAFERQKVTLWAKRDPAHNGTGVGSSSVSKPPEDPHAAQHQRYINPAVTETAHPTPGHHTPEQTTIPAAHEPPAILPTPTHMKKTMTGGLAGGCGPSVSQQMGIQQQGDHQWQYQHQQQGYGGAAFGGGMGHGQPMGGGQTVMPGLMSGPPGGAMNGMPPAMAMPMGHQGGAGIMGGHPTIQMMPPNDIHMTGGGGGGGGGGQAFPTPHTPHGHGMAPYPYPAPAPAIPQPQPQPHMGGRPTGPYMPQVLTVEQHCPTTPTNTTTMTQHSTKADGGGQWRDLGGRQEIDLPSSNLVLVKQQGQEGQGGEEGDCKEGEKGGCAKGQGGGCKKGADSAAGKEAHAGSGSVEDMVAMRIGFVQEKEGGQSTTTPPTTCTLPASLLKAEDAKATNGAFMMLRETYGLPRTHNHTLVYYTNTKAKTNTDTDKTSNTEGGVVGTMGEMVEVESLQMLIDKAAEGLAFYWHAQSSTRVPSGTASEEGSKTPGRPSKQSSSDGGRSTPDEKTGGVAKGAGADKGIGKEEVVGAGATEA